MLKLGRKGRWIGDKEAYRYPLVRYHERQYAADFSGPVYIWDIDKTYLATEIHSWRSLLYIPFEAAIDKRNIAGTEALLRELRRGISGRSESKVNPIYFVSASPPQLERVLRHKMLLDGVDYDGLSFKNHLALLKRGQFGKVREQVGYKLSALLLNRLELPYSVEEVLFGDDSEKDALIYAIYGDIVAGRLRGEALAWVLSKQSVRQEDVAYILELSEGMPKKDLVQRIFINLEVGRDPSRFAAFERRLVPTYDTFQTALRLYQDGHLGEEGVMRVALELVQHYRRNSPSLLRSIADFVGRGGVKLETVKTLWAELKTRGLVPDYFVLDESQRLEEKKEDVGDGFLTPKAFRPK